MDFFPNTTSQSNDSTTHECVDYPCLEPPFDEQTFIVIETVFEIAITGTISVFGVATNIINIIVFSRIGILSDSNTVSLTGLAISDFVCCLFTCWGNVCLCIMRHFKSLDLSWDVSGFYLHSFGRPRYVFTQITCWLTAYIAFERFVAIVFPFKVKRIFTAKHTLFAICCIYMTLFIADYPQCAWYIPTWVTNPTTNNRSILMYVPSGITLTHEMRIVFNTIFTILRLLSFAIVIICNVTMLRKLALRKFKKLSASPGVGAHIAMTANTSVIATHNITTITNCLAVSTITTTTTTAQRVGNVMPNRDNATNNITTITNDNITNNLAIFTITTTTTSAQTVGNVRPNRDNTTRKSKRHNKDTKIITMMSMVCTLFIVCYTPDVAKVIIFYILYLPLHRMVYDMVFICCLLLESINSSCNIFIYFYMSSRYRRQFKSWIGHNST